MTDQFIRIAALCLLLGSAETLHGIFRAAVLVPHIGKAAALKAGIVSGSLLALGICYWQVPAVGLAGSRQLFGLGLVLALFMAGFDVVLGKLLLRRSWRKIAAEFNPASGNYLLFGLLVLIASPWLVMQLQ